MAEAFGVVAGALSIAALFNNCVDCFEYVHVARNFDRDFTTAQLNLDWAKVRLTRWGEAVGINKDGRFSQLATTGPWDDITRLTLWQILRLFSDATKASAGFHNARTVAWDPSVDMAVTAQGLHKKFDSLTLQRHSRVGLLKKAKWALHTSKNLENLTKSIATLVEQLETNFPASLQTQLKNTAAAEMAIYDIEELKTIEGISGDSDKLASEAAKSALAQRRTISTGDLTMSPEARAKIGAHFSDAAVGSSFQPSQGSDIKVGDMNMQGKSRLQVGESYGGGSVWDN